MSLSLLKCVFCLYANEGHASWGRINKSHTIIALTKVSLLIGFSYTHSMCLKR